MPDTPNGFTYPIATDPVAGGAAAIQALAEDVDRRHGIGTALPAGPVNGEEFVLVDSLAAPTFAWRFRYASAITGPFKWLFLGGSPIYRYSAAALAVPAAATWGALGGTDLVVPRAGDYLGRVGGRLMASTVTGEIAICNASISNSPIGGSWPGGGHTYATVGGEARLPSLGVGNTLRVAVWGSTTSVNFGDRYLSLLPIAVA